MNKDLVQRLEDAGGKAVGLCGLDGSLLKADQLDTQLGFVGRFGRSTRRYSRTPRPTAMVPIVSTVGGRGYHGEVFNINADVAAARIAASLGAMKLILMTDVRGLLRDKDDESTLIPVVNVSDVSRLKKEGIISGGMIPKNRLLRGRGAPGRGQGPYHRRADAPLHLGGAVHRRGASAPCSIKSVAGQDMSRTPL